MRAYRTISVFLIGAAYSLNLPAGVITEVPFDYHRGEILVSVWIGETGPWTMMVDTGTDPSVISPHVAETAGIDLHPAEGEVEGGGTETIEVMEASIPLLVLGRLKVRNLATAVLDLSPLAERLERDLDGILGHSLLEGRIVRIDFPDRRLAFLDGPPAGREPTSSDSPEVLSSPFVYEDGVLIDAVTINGVTGRGLIDTGSNGLFKLAPTAVATFGLEKNLAQAVTTDSAGFLGVSRNRTGTVDRIAIGPYVRESPPVVFFGAGMGRDDVRWDLNIGNRFLEDFILTINYPGRLVRLEKPPPAEPAGAR